MSNFKTTQNVSSGVSPKVLNALMSSSGRPKGTPRKQWDELVEAKESGKIVKEKGKKARFLDFAISTTQMNTGTQQYGAGQTFKSRSIADEADSQNSQLVMARSKDRPSRTGPLGESLGPITSETGFTVNRRLSINPGLSEMLPVMSASAQIYRRYKFKKLALTYDPQVTEFSDAGRQGKITILYSQNPYSEDPADMAESLNNQPRVTGTPVERLVLDISELCSKFKPLFMRDERAPAGASLADYDVGVFRVVSDGIAVASQVLGNLRISYELELYDIRSVGVSTINQLPVMKNCCVSQWYKTSGGASSGLYGDFTFQSFSSLTGGASTGIECNGLGALVDSSYTQLFAISLPRGRYFVHQRARFIFNKVGAGSAAGTSPNSGGASAAATFDTTRWACCDNGGSALGNGVVPSNSFVWEVTDAADPSQFLAPVTWWSNGGDGTMSVSVVSIEYQITACA